MTAQVAALLEQAKGLTAEERAELRAGLDALDESPAWRAAMKAELEDRWQEYQAGVRGEPLDDVLDEIDAELDAMTP